MARERKNHIEVVIWLLLLQQSIVLSLEAWAIARSLIIDIVRLTHFLWFIGVLISCFLNFSIGLVHFVTGNQFQIVATILQSFWIVGKTYICRLVHSLLHWIRIIFDIPVLYSWPTTALSVFPTADIAVTRLGSFSWGSPSTEGWWARPAPGKWILGTAICLIQGLIATRLTWIDKNALLNLLDPLMCLEIMLIFPMGRLFRQSQSIADLTYQVTLQRLFQSHLRLSQRSLQILHHILFIYQTLPIILGFKWYC